MTTTKTKESRMSKNLQKALKAIDQAQGYLAEAGTAARAQGDFAAAVQIGCYAAQLYNVDTMDDLEGTGLRSLVVAVLEHEAEARS